MKRLSILLFALSAIVLCSFSLFAASNQPNITKNDSKVIVYYFHTTGRCPTCLKMEKYTDEALKQYFPDELKSGKIDFKVLDVEKPANEHFIKDYGLYTKSVVLSEVKTGKEIRWKNLDKIWTKVRDRNAYLAYIKQEVDAFMKGSGK
jgi:hypothetical protein